MPLKFLPAELRRQHRAGATLDHAFFSEEIERQERPRANYFRLRDKYPGMSPEWWFDTQDVEVAEIDAPQQTGRAVLQKPVAIIPWRGSLAIVFPPAFYLGRWGSLRLARRQRLPI